MPHALPTFRLATASNGLRPPPRKAYRYGLVLSTPKKLPPLRVFTQLAKPENGLPRLKLPQAPRDPEATREQMEQALWDYLARSPFRLDPVHVVHIDWNDEVDIVELPPHAAEAKNTDEIHIIWAHVGLLSPAPHLSVFSDIQEWILPAELPKHAQSYRDYRKVLTSFGLLP